MSNSFTQVFGGTTIYPADVSYLPLALTGNISLEWPLEATAGSTVVARIIDITPSGAYTITMPEATAVSVGQTVLFNNLGPSTVAVNKANGSAILSIGAGEQWQAYLIDNTTVGGTWRTLRYGAATAQAQAAALAGPGLVTDGSQLAQNYEVIDFSVTPYTLTGPDRAKVFVWDGGLGTLNLPSAPAAGDGWFVQVRNAGQGDLTIDPSGTELINAGSTLRLQPGDSAVIVSNGTQWFTIGLGQQAVFAFDYTSIAVTGGTYTLSGSELNRIAYKFTGTLVSNVTVVVPATVQQYWVNNSTTGAFTLSLRASGSGTSTPVTQASTSILYCDGTDIIPATTAVTFAGILPVSQGGTGANNAASARTNLGATGIGSSLFTATTAASARSTISAASSGANSDITSLSGLTTPLSVGQGGTGAATLTANGVVVGNGTSAVQVTAAGTTGQVLVGNTGGAPSWATLTGIGVTSFSGGTTGLTPASPTTGAITLAGTLGVANGGTGNTTFLSNYLLKGNGTSALTSSIVYDNGTNVGIATSSPTERLTVVGNTKIGEGVASNTSKFMVNTLSGVAAGIQLIQDANESWIIQNPASTNVLTFSNSGTERMRIDAAGNVGIGTAIPASYGKLAVRGNINASTDGATLLTMRANANATDLSAYNATGAYLAFQTTPNGGGELERMRITAGGNVGIGTTSPAASLEISSAFDEVFRLTSTGNPYASWYAGATRRGYIQAQPTAFTVASDTAIPLIFSTNVTERMRIDSAGLVGIGTAGQPIRGNLDISLGGLTTAGLERSIHFGYSSGDFYGFKLSNINSPGSFAAGTFSIQRGTTAAWVDALLIDNNGNAVIGGTSAAASTVKLTLTDGTITQTHGYFSGGVSYQGTISNHSTAFLTNNSERMRIDSSGNVGIGTSSPSARLDIDAGLLRFADGWGPVWGTGSNLPYISGSKAGNFLQIGVNGSERMRIDSAGNVGIGAVPPTLGYGRQLTISQGGGTANPSLVHQAVNTNDERIYLTNNMAFGTSGFSATYTYIKTGCAATYYLQTAGQHLWYNAPTGTAGNTISFTQAMTLDFNGNLGIGITNPSQRLEIVGRQINTVADDDYAIALNATTGNIRVLPYASAYSGSALIAYNAGYVGLGPLTIDASRMQFWTNSAERMRIASDGKVGIGTSNPLSLLVLSNGSGENIEFTPGSSTLNGGVIEYINRSAFPTTRPDLNYYIGVPGAHKFYTDTFERMRIDGSGNVGIGTNSPSYVLNTSYNANATFTNAGSDFTQMWQNSGTNALGVALADDLTARFVTNNSYAIAFNYAATELMRLTNVGYLGLGTASPANAIELAQGAGINAAISMRANGVAAAGELFVGQDAANSAYVYNRSGQPLVFGTTNTERARIESNGNFLVGTTNSSTIAGPGIKAVPAANGANGPQFAIVTAASTGSTASLSTYSTGAAAFRFYVDDGGTIYATSTAISAISDQRLKENVRDLDAGLDTILALKPRRFDWKAGKGKDVRDDMGFIAQEVETVLPELIGGWKAGEGEPDDLKSVKAGDLIPVLVKAIQELTARVAQLEGK